MSGEDSKSASYTRWMPEMDKVMLEVLREHKALGQKEDRNFNKVAYKDVSEAMKKVYGHSFSQDKVTNRLKTLKGNLGLVLDLLNKKSGFTWNDITKKVKNTPEIWENFIKSNNKYKTIRGKEIDNLDLLREIFEKDRATGNVAKNAKEKLERWNEEGIHIKDVDEVESHGVSGASFESEEPTHTTTTSNSSKNKSKKRKVEERDALVGEIKEVKEAIEKVASAISSSNRRIRKEEDILAELMRLGLRGHDLAAAANIFGNDPVAANMLFAYPEDTRIEWVNAKLRG